MTKALKLVWKLTFIGHCAFATTSYGSFTPTSAAVSSSWGGGFIGVHPVQCLVHDGLRSWFIHSTVIPEQSLPSTYPESGVFIKSLCDPPLTAHRIMRRHQCLHAARPSLVVIWTYSVTLLDVFPNRTTLSTDL